MNSTTTTPAKLRRLIVKAVNMEAVEGEPACIQRTPDGTTTILVRRGSLREDHIVREDLFTRDEVNLLRKAFGVPPVEVEPDYGIWRQFLPEVIDFPDVTIEADAF